MFQVEVVAKLGREKLSIEGRCCADEIRVGDKFTTILEQEWERDDQGTPHVQLKRPKEVVARVVAVESLRPNVIGTGETGVLLVESGTPDVIRSNRMLDGSVSRPGISGDRSS